MCFKAHALEPALHKSLAAEIVFLSQGACQHSHTCIYSQHKRFIASLCIKADGGFLQPEAALEGSNECSQNSLNPRNLLVLRVQQGTGSSMRKRHPQGTSSLNVSLKMITT